MRRPRTLLAVPVILALTGCSRAPERPVSTPSSGSQAAPTKPAATGDAVEGRRIALRVGCVGCHKSDGSGGGFLHESPDGDRIVAPNLTQRRTLYEDAGVAALLRQGKTHDGHRPLGMPIMMFQHLSDRELRDVIAWLRALPTVENPNLPEGRLSAKTQQRLRDGTLDNDDDRPDPGLRAPAIPPKEPLALGKYLAMTSCSECHGRDLNGFPGDEAPSLVVAKAYTQQQFARLIKTGLTATGKKSRTGFMSEVAVERFSVLTDAEVAALKQYLDSR